MSPDFVGYFDGLVAKGFDLDDVTEKHVGLAIFLLHHLKLVAQAQAATFHVTYRLLTNVYDDIITCNELDASIDQIVGSIIPG